MKKLRDFFDLSEKELKKLTKEYEKIDVLSKDYAELSDDDLKNKTAEFRKRLSSGETLEDIKYEAFATCREASKRALGLYPFKVQVIGGLNLHEGNISEMRTGEGKSIPTTTILPTPNGYKQASDIKVGDELFSLQGTSTKVLGVYPQGNKENFLMLLKDFRMSKSSPDHIWSVYPENSNELIDLTTAEINERMTLGNTFSIPMSKPAVYHCLEIDTDAYQEGYNLKNRLDHGEKLTSQEITILEIFSTASLNQRWQFIQGFMARNENKSLVYIDLLPREVFKVLRDILFSLGFSNTFTKQKNNTFTIYVNIVGDERNLFYKKSDLFPQESLKETYKQLDRVTITKIQASNYFEPHVCFKVDNPQSLFLMNEYIVTHNTLTATMPVYLNALEGKGVHVVTVNEYLSERDGTEMGELYNWLGLTVGVNTHDLSPSEKRNAYACDITYTTNSELGFDYLRDNMVTDIKDKVQRGLNYCVVDEVDSILIDEARTPLIISNSGSTSSNMYEYVDRIVKKLNEEDLIRDIENRLVDLSEKGIDKVEEMTKIPNIYAPEHYAFMHYLYMSLRANYVIERDTDYVVRDDQILLVDSFTGRIMDGRRYSDGLHQAIEAKENVTIQDENKTMASITYQNYFRMYRKLSGMTGTAKTEEEEFREIYNMIVVSIPTNKPVIREDKTDLIFPTMEYKFKAVVNDIKYLHEKGQPILVGTSSVQYSEHLSNLLTIENIPHEVLNAKNHKRESEIIMNAGQLGAITIATNMAGRGTDIKLGLGVKELGGLAVLGTERYESRRIDNQLRGRSGRQGDVGMSQFYVSLEDDLPKRFGGDKLKNLLTALLQATKVQGEETDMSLRSSVFTSQIESAQKRVEGNNYDSRKSVLQYDDILREQREAVYRDRDIILKEKDCILDNFINILENLRKRNYEDFLQVIKDFTPKETVDVSEESLLQIYEDKLNILNNKEPEFIEYYLTYIMLSALDNAWTILIDDLAHLKESISLRSYAQINPLVAYQEEAFNQYEAMMVEAKKELLKNLLHI